MKHRIIILPLLFALVMIACKKDENNIGEWLIPTDEIFDGGPGKDGIPALEYPNFLDPDLTTSYIQSEDLILGAEIGNRVKGYPHTILDWHEIINDSLGGTEFAVTYCPLTGTGIGWNRVVDGQLTTFGVSGLLYNTNLIPYDRRTNSYWSQMRNDCVSGDLISNKADLVHLVEVPWSTWSEMFPDVQVVSKSNGYSRDYGSYPYGDYKTNQDRLLFPLSPDDVRLPRKERVLGVVVNNQAKVYQFGHFASQTYNTLQDQFQGQEIVILGSQEKNVLVAYNRRMPDGTLLEFSPINDEDPITLMQDQEGNKYNIFGRIVEGPRMGQRLGTLDSYIGYWLSWGAFYQNAMIYTP